MKIKYTGYYISDSVHWIDWHAGVKFEGDNYYVLKFDAYKCYINSVTDKNSVDLDNLVKNENFGLYKVRDRMIEIRYNPNTEFELQRRFTILSSEILLDEELKEYRYVKLSYKADTNEA